jgi:hypothetical protein
MPPVKSLNSFITVRVSGKVRTAFHRKAERFGKPSDVMRELIEAFLDDRLVIKPDPKKESLYVTRTEN